MTSFLIEDQPEAASKVRKRAIRCCGESFALEVDDPPLDERVSTASKGEVENDVVANRVPARALARSLIALQAVKLECLLYMPLLVVSGDVATLSV